MKSTSTFLILTICYLASCSTTDCKTPESNTNKDSELTLLMRKMFDDGELIKAAVLNDEKIESLLKHEALLTAQSTQPEKAQSASYKAFANNYLKLLNELKDPNNLNKLESYENMVNSCISCHQTLCPGPIVKINKLKI